MKTMNGPYINLYNTNRNFSFCSSLSNSLLQICSKHRNVGVVDIILPGFSHTTGITVLRHFDGIFILFYSLVKDANTLVVCEIERYYSNKMIIITIKRGEVAIYIYVFSKQFYSPNLGRDHHRQNHTRYSWQLTLQNFNLIF